MTKPNYDELFNEIVSTKIAAEDFDSGWAIAHAIARLQPVLKDIADNLARIDSALGPELAGSSIAERIREISVFLNNEVRPLMRKLGEHR